MKGKRKQNLNKLRTLDTCQALNNIQNDPVDRVYLDNGSDTFGMSGNAWIIESTTGRKVDIEGYNSKDTIISEVPIEYAVTDIELPDGKTIIYQGNEATIIGESENSLFSETQM